MGTLRRSTARISTREFTRKWIHLERSSRPPLFSCTSASDICWPNVASELGLVMAKTDVVMKCESTWRDLMRARVRFERRTHFGPSGRGQLVVDVSDRYAVIRAGLHQDTTRASIAIGTAYRSIGRQRDRSRSGIGPGQIDC